jgi:hypothetical protein
MIRLSVATLCAVMLSASSVMAMPAAKTVLPPHVTAQPLHLVTAKRKPPKEMAKVMSYPSMGACMAAHQLTSSTIKQGCCNKIEGTMPGSFEYDPVCARWQ